MTCASRIQVYLYKLVVPVNLAMIYPRWNIDGGRILSFVPLALLLSCFVVLWRYRKGWGRGPLVAVGSFAIVLAPVLGLPTMSYMQYSLVADHLQYPGMPGIVALIGSGMGAAWSWAKRKGNMGILAGVVTTIVAIVMILGVLTWRQAKVYHAPITFWSHSISINDGAWAAFYNRGVAYDDANQPDLAIRDYAKTIELRPGYAEAYNNRGNAYGRKGNYDLAISDHSKAIKLKPDFAEAYRNRAVDYYSLKQYDKSWDDVRMCKNLDGNPDVKFVDELRKASGRME